MSLTHLRAFQHTQVAPDIEHMKCLFLFYHFYLTLHTTFNDSEYGVVFVDKLKRVHKPLNRGEIVQNIRTFLTKNEFYCFAMYKTGHEEVLENLCTMDTRVLEKRIKRQKEENDNGIHDGLLLYHPKENDRAFQSCIIKIITNEKTSTIIRYKQTWKSFLIHNDPLLDLIT